MIKPLNASGYDTDKALLPHYLRNYERIFEHLWNEKVTLLELGVNRGGSLLMWRDYFERGTIVGLDLNPVSVDDPTGRVFVYSGAQEDTTLLTRIARERAPDGFDIIIDDCSHIGVYARISFWHLFDNHLKSGGLYIIEDWGTGYWDKWPDGAAYRPHSGPRYSTFLHRVSMGAASISRKGWARSLPFVARILRWTKKGALERQFRSHNIGMAGFIKEIVDECAMGDITEKTMGSPPYRPSKIREMRISHGHVFIIKGAAS